MAVPLSDLISNRLLSTKKLLKELSTNIIENTTDEVKAIYGYDDRKESELSLLEKSYLADLVAVALLRFSLDRYKEDAKTTEGPDGLIHEAQNRLAYLQDMIERYETDAANKASKLGKGPAVGGYSPLITKIPAQNESGSA